MDQLRESVVRMRYLGYSGLMLLTMNPLQAKDAGIGEGSVIVVDTDTHADPYFPPTTNTITISYNGELNYGDMLLGAMAH